MKKVLLLLLLFVIISNAHSQIRLVEVDPTTDFVSIKNFGGSSEDISTFRLCALFLYKTLSTMTVESGNLNLGAGETVVLSGWALNNNASDLGIYLATGSFGSAAAMVDFTQWGAGGLGRESVAVTKGIWNVGEFIEGDAPYSYIGDGTQNKLPFWQAAPNTETDILSYSFPEESGPATIDAVNHTVDVEVAFGTDLSNLIATFELSEGATTQVSAADQESGVTANDFTNPITYTVTAEDGTTMQDWIVTVTVALNSEADILSYSFAEETGPATIGDGTIDIEVAMGTNLTNLEATFTLSENASAEISAIPQVSGVTANNFTSPVIYTVTAEDATTKDWVVTVTEDQPLSTETDFLTFSFSEQSGPATINTTNHTIDIVVNPGTDPSALEATFTISEGAIVGVGSTPQQSGVTVNDFTDPVTYRITAEDGVTFQDWTVTIILNNETDILSFSVPGQININLDNTNHSVDIEVEGVTDLTSLVATFELPLGATAEIITTAQISGTTPNDFTNPVTYTITAEDGTTTQDWIVTIILDPQTDFLSFSFGEETGLAVINAVAHKILVEVEFGTDLTNLIASFALSDGATADINTVAQVSGVTANDFTNPVTYKVISSGGTNTQNWEITVTIGPSIETDFLTFSISDQTGPPVIDINNHTIDIEVGFGTDLTNLTVTFTFSEGATVEVNDIIQESGVTVNDFTDPVTYLVTAEDGTTAQEWVVTVTVAPNTETGILSFSFTEQTTTAVIDNIANTITVEVAFGTDLTNLVASFTLSAGATAKVGTTDQVSGTTGNDFSIPVTYAITAEDGIINQEWIVSVTTAPNTETDFISFSIPEEAEPAVINITSHLIDVLVSFGTDLTGLVASFTLSEGATASVNGMLQQSGVSLNDFSGPIIYTVLAEDGITSQEWTICVSVAPNTETDILAFSFAEQTTFAAIDNIIRQVSVEVETEADLANLVAMFTLSIGASAEVNGVTQESGVTANNYSSPLLFQVKAEDGITVQDWIITVTQQEITAVKGSAKSIDLKIFPNPAQEYLQLNIQNDFIGPVSLIIRDTQGKELIMKHYQKSELLLKDFVDVKEFKGPLLIIDVTYGNIRSSRRIIKDL